ncbi:MAG: TIGR03960 family B12-binding radical SAM protein [Thermotogae bacterium]|nr:TIGR03960 family B12-binding radical SAM protein [Thermotogota bacterium]MCP5465226.1 TIGR03960 family B12-binding radical SAM protein [Thermotogota bacterium]
MKISEFIFNTGVLHKVSKPQRYFGGEYNETNKKNAEVKIAMCFPDLYDVGMSHTGFHILYNTFNSVKNTSCERVFLPWFDMIEEMQKYSIPLWSLETLRPVKEFDVLGITLQYELSYTNAVKIIDLSGIPVWAKDRTENDPIVLAGGPCASNPEPVADFFDVIFVGDGETAAEEISEIISKKISRKDKLKEFSKKEGFYVPSLYKTKKSERGLIIPYTDNKEIPDKVKAKKVYDLNTVEFPDSQIVSNTRLVHERAIVEVMRGCNRGCRFCHAGMYYRPVRERNADTISKKSIDLLKKTGYPELSLLSLSTLDHSNLEEMVDNMLPFLEERKIGLSLPSSRVDKFGLEISSKLDTGRKSGLTFAPEAGSQRMRDNINKGINEDEITEVIKTAKETGWKKVKLYFMIGLPGETTEDIEEICALARKIRKESRMRDITVNASILVPKPHTPFQYAEFCGTDEAKEKAKILSALKKEKFTVRIHDVYESYVEAIFSRGDRNLSKIIYDAVFKENAIFQQTEDNFNFRAWARIFNENDFDSSVYLKEFSTEDELPWNIIDMLISEKFFISEWQKSKEEILTPDCRWNKCSVCGVCIENDYKICKEK